MARIRNPGRFPPHDESTARRPRRRPIARRDRPTRPAHRPILGRARRPGDRLPSPRHPGPADAAPGRDRGMPPRRLASWSPGAGSRSPRRADRGAAAADRARGAQRRPRIEPGGAAKGGKRSRQPTHLGQRHAALATTPGGGASIGGDAIPGIGSRARQDRRGGQCRLPAQVRLGAVAQEAYFGQRTQAGAVLARTGRRPWERDRGLPLCRFRASRSGSAALLEFATAAAGAGIIAPWPSRRRGGPWATAQGVAPDGAEDRRTPRSARRLLARSTGIGWAMSPGPHGDWASDDAGIEVQARGIWTQRRPSN